LFSGKPENVGYPTEGEIFLILSGFELSHLYK